MSTKSEVERVGTVVVGGGQAGLSVGYHLARRGLDFVILDAHERIGDSWRLRWDSLRLFTPARYDALPGMRFPAGGATFPTKDEMANYLESYAKRFSLPVRTGLRVTGLAREGNRFVVTAGTKRFEADNVVVAMSNFQSPQVPSFAGSLDASILQIHSLDYRNPAQLRDGSALIVGAGNSAADIAIEVARTHPTLMSGKESGHIPIRIETAAWRYFAVRGFRFFGHRILTVSTPIGRKLRPKLRVRSAPLIRVKPEDLVAAGIERVARVVGAKDGRPLLGDGRVLDVANVVWCTGFNPGFAWINVPIFGTDGEPRHERGLVTEVPGLFFVGLHFLYSMTSATVTGVGRDANRIADAIDVRSRTRRAA